MRGDEWSGDRSDTVRMRKREGKEMVGMEIEERSEERRLMVMMRGKE